jgi:hypothetical protein
MAGRVQHRRDDVAEGKHLPVAYALERKRDRRRSGEHIFGTRAFGEVATGGKVVGMNVRVDDEADAHSRVLGCAQVRPDVTSRVDHGTGRMPAAAEEVGDADRIVMQELTEDHGLALRMARR